MYGIEAFIIAGLIRLALLSDRATQFEQPRSLVLWALFWIPVPWLHLETRTDRQHRCVCLRSPSAVAAAPSRVANLSEI